MEAIYPVVVRLIEQFCGWVMLGGVVSGAGMGLLLLARHGVSSLSHRFLLLLLLAFAGTLFSNYLMYKHGYEAYPRLYFLPFHASFSLGPLYFFYIKSKLYPALQLSSRDIKHFLMPSLQLITLAILSFSGIPFRLEVMACCSSPIYGFVENAVYIWLMAMYLYFAYRFIRYERWVAARSGARKRYLLILGWLKRQAKVMTILFGLHATCLVTFFISYRFLGIDLSGKLLFSFLREGSFAGMLYWLVLNAFFAWRKGL